MKKGQFIVYTFEAFDQYATGTGTVISRHLTSEAKDNAIKKYNGNDCIDYFYSTIDQKVGTEFSIGT